MSDGKSGGSAQLIRLDTLQRETVRVAAAPHYFEPLGDFRLRRFRRSEFRFDSVPAGDTLSVDLTSAADPFKKVVLSALDTQKNIPVFTHQSRAQETGKPVLSVKSKISLKRELAHLEARTTPPAREIQRYVLRELWVQANNTAQPDTIQRDWAIDEQGRKMLTDEQKVQRDSTGRMTRKKKTVAITMHPFNPVALAPGGIQTLPRCGKRVFRYSGYKPGDTLLFNVAALGGKPLKRITLSDNKGRYNREARETAAFSDKVVAGGEAYWELRLEGTFGLQKQRANISVFRISPARMDSVIRHSDTVMLVKKTPLYDTLALLVKDDSLVLTPILNLSQKNVAGLEVTIPDTLPKGFQLLFAAYWIGINRPCLDMYAALEQTIPQNWIKPGVPPALCAYALGKPLALPPVTQSDVVLKFNRGGNYAADSYGAAPLWGVSLKQSMGTLSRADLLRNLPPSVNYHFYVCFKNNNQVNTYPAQVKIIAFYRKKKGETTTTTVLNIDNR